MIKKIPPVEQDIFFQDCQFDPRIGEGTDPHNFWRGRPLRFGRNKSRDRKHNLDGTSKTLTRAEKFIKVAKELLKGHKNEEEILKTLKLGAKE